MKKIYSGRSGDLKNTTFAILAPNGRRKLTRTGRAPFHEYRDAARMAAGMNEIAKRFEQPSGVKLKDAPIPFTDSLDIGLNISAADELPMIVIVANQTSELDVMSDRVRTLTWSDDLIGQFTYARVTDPNQLKPLTGIEGSLDDLNAVLVVQPGQFGLSGKVLLQFDPTTNDQEWKRDLLQIARDFERAEKDHRNHVQLGIKMGIDWESAIPETDQESIAARRRARGE